MSANSKIPVVATIITLMAVVIMFGLGQWQLQRAEYKQQRLEQIEQKKLSAPFELENILKLKDRQDIRDLPVIAQGHFIQGRYFLLDNRVNRGRVGYEVVVPLESDTGTVLVNFGWVAAGEYRQQLPKLDLPLGQIKLPGVVALPALNPLISETAVANQQWPKVIQQLDLEIISGLMNQPLLPLVILLNQDDTRGFVRDWKPVVMPPEKHIAYAVQWFALGVAAALIFGFTLRARRKKEDI